MYHVGIFLETSEVHSVSLRPTKIGGSFNIFIKAGRDQVLSLQRAYLPLPSITASMQLLSLLLVSLALALSSSAAHGKGKHRASTSPTPAAPTTTTSSSAIPTSTTAGNPSCAPYVGPTPTAVSKSGKANLKYFTQRSAHNIRPSRFCCLHS